MATVGTYLGHFKWKMKTTPPHNFNDENGGRQLKGGFIIDLWGRQDLLFILFCPRLLTRFYRSKMLPCKRINSVVVFFPWTPTVNGGKPLRTSLVIWKKCFTLFELASFKDWTTNRNKDRL